MSGRLISIIYFYLISAIATILLVIGVYNTISFVINSTQYDKYPLRYGSSADRCAYMVSPLPATAPSANGEVSVAPSPINPEQERQKKQCEENLEAERKQNKVNDIKNTLAFTIIGLVLLAIHFPIALRRSNLSK